MKSGSEILALPPPPFEKDGGGENNQQQQFLKGKNFFVLFVHFLLLRHVPPCFDRVTTRLKNPWVNQ
jgi:hypothetical protein